MAGLKKNKGLSVAAWQALNPYNRVQVNEGRWEGDDLLARRDVSERLSLEECRRCPSSLQYFLRD
jgi:hypothetical protein